MSIHERMPDHLFERAVDHLATSLKSYDRFLRDNGGKEGTHTDVLRAHISGAKWMIESLFGQSERFRVEDEAEKRTGIEVPHPGPRAEED